MYLFLLQIKINFTFLIIKRTPQLFETSERMRPEGTPLQRNGLESLTASYHGTPDTVRPSEKGFATPASRCQPLTSRW